MKKHFKRHKIKYFVGVFATLAMLFMSQTTIFIPRPRVELTFESSTKTLEVREEATVTLFLKASSAINAVEGTVAYSPNLTLVSIDKTQSFIELWSEEPLAGDNRIHFGGGTTKLGQSGKMPVLAFKVRAKEAGEAKITFEEFEVRAADGQGTEAISSAKPLLLAMKEPPPKLPFAGGGGGGSTVFSPASKFTIQDVSRMSALLWSGQYDQTYDLNNDGRISLADISIGLLLILK